MKKKSSIIDVPNDNSGKGDDNFCRFEYWGIGPYFLVHYVGDSTVFEGFSHRNSKDTIKPFKAFSHLNRFSSPFAKCILQFISNAHRAISHYTD